LRLVDTALAAETEILEERSSKSNKPSRLFEISDTQLAKFWGADLAELTAEQKALITQLFQKIEQRHQQ
jgi:hypothetical protein